MSDGVDGSDERPSKGSVPMADLVAIVALGSAYVLTVLMGEPTGGVRSFTTEFVALVRAVLGMTLVLFAPGYLLLLVVSPRLGADADDGFARGELLVVSFLGSVAFVIVQAFLLDSFGGGVEAGAIVFFTTATVVVVAILAGAIRIRRAEGPIVVGLPSLRSTIDRVRSPPTRVDLALNVTLAVLLISGSTALVLPSVGDETARFTELALLTENDSGELVSANVSSVFDSEDSGSLVASITNREHDSRRYTLVVQGQSAVVGDRAVRVLDRYRLDEYDVTLPHNGTDRVRYRIDVPPNGSGSGCRLAFLLYRGDAPQSPTADNAYRELHVWDGEPPVTRENACSSAGTVTVTRG